MDTRSSRIIIHGHDFPPSQSLGETAESYWKRLFKLVKGTGIPARRCDAVCSTGNMLNPVMSCKPPMW